jgi:NAD(P)-dependent dehydrogenase (short-subunit alcohol dehydrogenase family)
MKMPWSDMPHATEEFHGRVAIVTGAAQGIGFAIAQAFVSGGARVALLDLNRQLACESAARLGPIGDRTLALAADVADDDSIDAAVAGVMEQWGQIDILVNNAGIQFNCASLDLRSEDLHRVLNINLVGAFHASQAAARASMVPRKTGAIINISSVASFLSFPRRLPYGIAKAGINALTRILAVEWAPHNIRVNAIAPGYIRTRLVEDAARWGHIDLPAITAKTPAERLGEVEEIAELAVFLAGDKSGFITGQVITADGGFALTK